MHPLRRVRPGPRVVILDVVERVERERPHPGGPPLGVDEALDVGLHDDRPRQLLPGAAEVDLEGRVGLEQLLLGREGAALDDGDAGEVLLGAALRRHHAGLVRVGLAHDEVALLEDRDGVAEDEVNGAADLALAVQLAVDLRVQGVLVAVHVDVVEDAQVA